MVTVLLVSSLFLVLQCVTLYLLHRQQNKTGESGESEQRRRKCECVWWNRWNCIRWGINVGFMKRWRGLSRYTVRKGNERTIDNEHDYGEMQTRAVLLFLRTRMAISLATVHHGNLDSKNGKRLESQKTDLRVFFQNSVNIRNMNLDSKIGKRLEKWKKTRFIGLTH